MVMVMFMVMIMVIFMVPERPAPIYALHAMVFSDGTLVFF